MATYYLNSTTGNDLNNGTSAGTAYASLSKINTLNLNAGDTIVIAGNTTYSGALNLGSDDDGAAGNPITVRWDGVGAKPIINAPGNNAITLTDSDYVTIEGLDLRGADLGAIDVNAASDNVTVRYTDISDSGWGIEAKGQYGLYTGNYIHDLKMIVNTVGGDDDYGAGAFAIYGSNNEFSYNYILRAEAPSYDYGTDGGGFATWKTLSNLSIHHNIVEDSDGFFEAGGETGDTLGATDIHHNVSLNNGGFSWIHNGGGNFAMTFTDMEINHNTIYDDSGVWWPVGFGATPGNWFNFHDNIVTNMNSGGGPIFSHAVSNRAGNRYTNDAPGTLLTGETTGSANYVNAPSDLHIGAGGPTTKGAYSDGLLGDWKLGTGEDDDFNGTAGHDYYQGGAGSDDFYPGAGNDVMMGGAGADWWVLEANQGVDRLLDFTAADDTIDLGTTFSSLTNGTLQSSEFRVGSAAVDANDYIIYNSATGAVYYDSNGSGAGGSQQFLQLNPGTTLNSWDFYVY